MDSRRSPSPQTLDTPLIDVAVESWRFARLFERVLGKLDAGEQTRYVNQLRYYLKRLEEGLAAAGLRLVNVEGSSTIRASRRPPSTSRTSTPTTRC